MVPDADTIVATIFQRAAEDEVTSEIAASLKEVWRAGKWSADAIVRAVEESAGSPDQKP